VVNDSIASTDPITEEIISSTIQSVAEEMFLCMKQTAISTIIYEVLDLGTGITNSEGELVGTGFGIPAFISILSFSVRAVIDKFILNKPTMSSPKMERDIPEDAIGVSEGDMFILNDPYEGGVTHLNDVVLVLPIFSKGTLVAWAANIAHWTDIGGMKE
jgi:N-methylhydantoinase B